jgi:hypothetical protein
MAGGRGAGEETIIYIIWEFEGIDGIKRHYKALTFTAKDQAWHRSILCIL